MIADKTGNDGDGEMLRQVYGGGHTLYWLSEVEVIASIKDKNPLLVFRLEHTKANENSDLLSAILIYGFLGITIAAILGPMIYGWKTGGEGVWFLVFVTLLVCVVGVIWDPTKSPFKWWKAEKHLDFTAREVVEETNGFSREKKAEVPSRKVISFDKLVLLCHFNNHWENGGTIDLTLAKPVKSKNGIRFPQSSYICHIYKSHSSETAIPADVKRVADAFIEITGVKFIDAVS